MRSPRPRRALTLIELLVVVGVIGILCALLLPAVAYVRQASNRSTCARRLKQFGVALSVYQSAYGCFPSSNAATIISPTSGARIAMDGYSIHVRLLPFLEQSELYDGVNFALRPQSAAAAGTHVTANSRRLVQFLCPSNDVALPRVGANIRVNVGVYSMGSQRGPLLGAFSSFDWVRPQDVTDGLAKTAFAAERLRGVVRLAEVRYGAELAAIPIPGNPDDQQRICGQVRDFRTAYDTGESWLYTGAGYTTYRHIAAPNSPIVDCVHSESVELVDDRLKMYGMISARSFHAGVVNVLFGDGSVNAVADATDLVVWRAMGTRAGGEF